MSPVELRAPELKTPNPSDRVALRGVRVRSRLSGMSQKTVVEQTYLNLEPVAIEAVYTFPLPENAAVCGFEVLTGDHVLTGITDNADKAIEQYEQAVADGDAGYLLEQERPDVFTLRVGNIKPKQTATIKITYVGQLELVDRAIRLTFPTTLAPRYQTGSGADPIDAAIDGDALNPPHALTVPYGLDLEVDVALGRKLQRITSPTHHIGEKEIEDGLTRITLRGGLTEMDREVVLSIELAKEHGPCVELVEGKPGTDESFLAVTFAPEFDGSDLIDGAPQASETVFVLDCSGSMQGRSMEQAAAALELCLRSLSPGDTFNICRFGSTYELMSREPLVYSQATMQRALEYVRQFKDLGGTEFLEPLDRILGAAPASGRVRQVILLTDGQVSNEPAIIALSRRLRAHNRIFTFGIGPASSHFLVHGLARATGGAAEFIAYHERIEDKVLRTFARLNSPAVENVEIDWGGGEVQTPAGIPPVFDCDVLTVFGRVIGLPPKRVKLRCTLGGGKREWEVPVGVRRPDIDRVVATMWARRTMQSLEEENDIRHTALSAAAGPTREREILFRLSKEFNLLCSLTSFVAIEHRTPEERNEGRPALRRVPVKLAKGWGGIDLCGPIPLSASASVPLACLSAPSAPSPVRAVQNLLTRLRKPKQTKPADSIRPIPELTLPTFLERSTLQPDKSLAPLRALLSSQLADGAFELSAPAIKEIDPEFRRVVKEAFVDTFGPRSGNTSLNTVLALLLLRQRFADQRRLWRRAEAKAIRLLALSLGKPKDEMETWLGALQSDMSASGVSARG